ncbi:MAG: carboxyl transferase domain-containing protein [Oscillospiraceae bacterium]|nr:carboxyl transferase domain-containing protein [Oscillospiraceae bacterium]
MSQKDKKLSAAERLGLLFDDGRYTEIDEQNGAQCGAIAAFGSIGGSTAFAFAQDSDEAGGAINVLQSRKLSRVYDLAAKTGSPIVSIYDSKGVKLDGDGFEILKAISEIMRKSSDLSGVVPQFAVVLGQCGGFLSLCAALADVCVMSERGELFLTSAYTDKALGGKEKDVGSADYAERAGVASVACSSESEAIAKTAELVKLFPMNNLAALPVYDYEEPAFSARNITAAVADPGSVTGFFDTLGLNAKTSLARIGGVPCGIIETGGELSRRDTAKCARLVEICDSFSMPVISLIDSNGLERSAESDRLGGIRNAAKLANVLSEATTVKLTVITGECQGAVYALFCGKNGGADMTYAWNDAVISPTSCEIAVELFWNERIDKEADIAALAKEYAAAEASAAMAAQAGAIDAAIAPEQTRESLLAALKMLSGKRVARRPKKHSNLPL